MKSPDGRTLFAEGPVDDKCEFVVEKSVGTEVQLTRRLEMSLGLWSDATVPKIVGCKDEKRTFE